MPSTFKHYHTTNGDYQHVRETSVAVGGARFTQLRSFPKIECSSRADLLGGEETVNVGRKLWSPKWALYKPLSFALNEKLSLAADAMAEDKFQNQVYLDYAAFGSYSNETTTLDLVTMADEIFVCNPVYPDSIPCDSYFDGPMALDTVADGIIASTSDIIPSQVCPRDFYLDGPMALDTVADGIIARTNFDIIPSQVCPRDSYFDDPITLNTEAGNGVFPEYIACDSDGNEPLTFNTEADNQIVPNGGEPLTLNLASTVADDNFDFQIPIFPDFEEPTTRGFEKWKESWDEKMLLVQWKRGGKDWEDITKSFEKMKTRNGNTRKSMLQRADSEIEALGKAAAADREGEADRLRALTLSYTLGDAVRVDYDGLWARISESMKNYGSERKWSSHRVKYAWNHGASSLFPHVPLRQRKLFSAILL